MYLKILATALSAPVAFAALASDTGLSFYTGENQYGD